MRSSKKFLAFDIGASSGRAVVGIFNKGKLALDEIHRFPNEPIEVHSSRDPEPPVNLTLGDCSGEKNSMPATVLYTQAIRNS